MKNFIYLVQGQSDLVGKYLHLRDREDSDTIFLTYDKLLDGAIFFPNSTWAQGRNKLLECALAQGAYMYFIFCDDDISFLRGSWDEFESRLLAFKPSIGVPIVLRTRKHTLPWFKCQYFAVNDEQLMAFHQDVVLDGIVLPYQEQFDHIHWWAAGEIQEILIQNLYSKNILQFNNIEISNDYHDRYDHLSGRDIVKKVVWDWLRTQFSGKYRSTKNPLGGFGGRVVFRCINLWRTLIYLFSRCFFPSSLNHSVREDKFRKMMRSDSKLFKQYKHIIKCQ